MTANDFKTWFYRLGFYKPNKQAGSSANFEVTSSTSESLQHYTPSRSWNITYIYVPDALCWQPVWRWRCVPG